MATPVVIELKGILYTVCSKNFIKVNRVQPLSLHTLNTFNNHTVNKRQNSGTKTFVFLW